MAENNNDNSIEFRVIHKRRNRLENNDDPHQCKTIVKIEPHYMQKFGIKEGEIVKISGNIKSTAAICLPMSDVDFQEVDEPEMEVEFLNNPEKKVEYFPKIILYGSVSCNVDASREWQRTIKLSKFPKNQTRSEELPEAEIVTLATMDIAEKLMSGYQSNLDYSKIMGFVVTKNDRINIPFQKEWFENKQQEILRKYNHEEHQNMSSRPNRSHPHEPIFPDSFHSAIVNVKPEGKPFWNITNNTKFEFENADIRQIFDPYRFTPKKLVNVVSISKQIIVEDTEFTIPSLEVYSNMMKLIWYSHQRKKIPESDFTDIPKINRIHILYNDHPRMIISLKDDLGNKYNSTNESGGGGGSSGPDPVTREFVSDSSWHSIFLPTLDPNAKEIIVTIKEIQWIKQNRAAMDIPSPAPREPPHMTPIEKQFPPKVVIAEGPWTFNIPINWQNQPSSNEK